MLCGKAPAVRHVYSSVELSYLKAPAIYIPILTSDVDDKNPLISLLNLCRKAPEVRHVYSSVGRHV